MEFDICGLFGLGIHHKLLLTSLMFDTKLHIYTLFHHTLHFHMGMKFTTDIEQATVLWILNTVYPDFPCELCIVTSLKILSNSTFRMPGTKLKMSLETYLSNFVCPSVTFLSVPKERNSLLILVNAHGIHGCKSSSCSRVVFIQFRILFQIQLDELRMVLFL
jgi:hypothetical protein